MDKSLVIIMQQACIFAVIAQMIFYFRPNDTYEKYLKLLIGMILIAVLFVPILNLFHLADAENFQNVIRSYEQDIQEIYEKVYSGEVNFKELSNQIEENEDQFSALETEIKTRINNIKSANYTSENVNITGVKNVDGQNDLTDMLIEIDMKKRESGMEHIGIEPVKVKESEENKESEKDRIKELIEEELGIEKERMIINLNE